ncbi:restriction endonuclease subunit S [Aeromonas veronii]
MSTMNQLGKYQPYPDYKDSGVEWLGVIPPEWQKMPLKRHCKVVSGYAFPSEMFIDSGLPVIRIGDIKSDGSVVLDDCKYIEKESGYLYSRFTIASGELLMAMTGATIGKAGWFKSDTKAFLNQRVGVFRVSGGFEYKFLWYVLNSSGYQEYIQLTAFGGAQPNISDTGMLAYEAAFPTINEQRTIAAFLDYETARIDQLIAKQQQLIELLKEKRQAVISHAVTKGLNPHAPMKDSGVEWLGQVPEHWGVMPIRHLSSFIGTGGTPKDPTSFTEEKDILWFSPGDFNGDLLIDKSSKYVTKSSVINNDVKIYSQNSVLIVGIGATLGKVAVCQHEFSCNQQINIVTPNSLMCMYFMAYSLLAQTEQMKQISNASTIGIMNQEKTKNIRVAMPSLEEQNEIINYLKNKLDGFSKIMDRSSKAINLLQERRTALISAAVTGKIDLRGWQPPKREVAA